MAYTELDRINSELEWFMELNDALSDGRAKDAADSVGQAIRELRKLQKLLFDDRPIDTGADADRDFNPALAAAWRPNFSDAERRRCATARLETTLRRYLEPKAANVDSLIVKSPEPDD